MKSNSEDFLKPKNGPVTFILVAINIIVFIVLEIMGDTNSGGFMLQQGAMNPYLILSNREWYRLFTCLFMHFGIEHLANNMLLLFLLGQIFERAVGTTRYIGIYIGAGLCGSFLSFFYMCLMGKNDIVAGASGAIFGIVGGMIVVILVNKGKYAGISAKRMLFMAAITLYFGFANAGTDNVGHLGGLISGFLLTLITYGIPTLIRVHRNRHIEMNDEKSYTLDNNEHKEG